MKFAGLILTVLFFSSCEKNVVSEKDMVNFEANDLQGKYVVNYDLFKSTGANYDLSTLVNRSDTFELKILADSSKLTWRSLTQNKSFQFDASTNSIPFKLKQYKQVTIKLWGEATPYKGSINSGTIQWKIFPYVEPYIIDDKNPVIWSGFTKDTEGKIKLTGSDVDINQGQYHVRSAAGSDYNGGPEWHFIFHTGEKIN